MNVDQFLSQEWIKEARYAYKEQLTHIEADIGECMEECCRRDVKNQVYSSKMNAKLKDLDPSTRATRIRGLKPAQAAFHGTTSAGSSPQDHGSHFDSQGSTVKVTSVLTDERIPASAEDQLEVDKLRRQRMRAILQRRRSAKAAADAGYGSLRDVSSTAAQEVVSESSAVVVHLWESGFAAEFDELLSQMALRWPGTRFMRTPMTHCREWLRRLRQPQQPMLLAAKQGRMVGLVSVADLLRSSESKGGGGGLSPDESSDFGESDCEPCLGDTCTSSVQESAAEGWLRCLGVLRSKAPSMHVRSGGKSFLPSGSSDEEEGAQGVDEWKTPCTVCGRTYPHEHKRAVRKGGVDSESDEG